MYFINHEQIDARIQFLSDLTDAVKQLEQQWEQGDNGLVWQLAQERVLHLAIETVTDVGSLLIDAFILRDASSYEDIVEIVHGEGAYSESLTATLLELVKLRKPLVQDFVDWNRQALHPVLSKLPAAFEEFGASVRAFIKSELE
ncbi:DUF86 domain-containing protein [Paenibacillus chondroitinus]|uniref:DUF86 domain-containing protein n=1 Tax=Paenibacillus chondroitinus TaxID=59842 RepID=A0ABU6DDS8_9BACL|nr:MULTISPECIES: HepT-like ribonuclease domain-containing protein [Paenibacillus]MCY9663235.1 DUF86 domain-containing protein [Paenibacillus anseongense]MEB4795051.1 DUF86 domain-containing protein [Paenibacillus chondroitinus]